jgi:hypothetical protein
MGPDRVPLLAGLVTVTPANAAGANKADRHTRIARGFRMQSISKNWFLAFWTAELRALTSEHGRAQTKWRKLVMVVKRGPTLSWHDFSTTRTLNN